MVADWQMCVLMVVALSVGYFLGYIYARRNP